MIDKEKADPVKVSALKQIALQFNGVDRASQRQCLVAAFELYPILTTVEIRDYLNILHPAGRVMELREQGCNIVTLWVTVEADNCTKHRIGQYLWVRGEREAVEVPAHA